MVMNRNGELGLVPIYVLYFESLTMRTGVSARMLFMGTEYTTKKGTGGSQVPLNGHCLNLLLADCAE
jgi:hypothetical protein